MVKETKGYDINNGILDLSGLALTKVPRDLPDEGIKVLRLNNNKIRTITHIPDSVDVLIINDNKIKDIKNLPPTIRRVNVRNNRITEIPEELPPTLRVLMVNGNDITVIPKMHDRMTSLTIDKKGLNNHKYTQAGLKVMIK